ncbi:hypothetical protein PQD17_gp48 [Pantoea phage PdC23]|uniref:Uncharacterized protein n=1 Tax=Pantoea phage PdC23 TaxID=2894356 RepID=A0AAE9C893_9CAUD|nr:hypothetical protein PQD17_gp48 [Pantoea phage PdC23]UGC97761.1 hypothetical protein pdc_048 [Pantoea phage PdC23]
MFIPVWVLLLICFICIMFGALVGMFTLAMCKMAKFDEPAIANQKTS